MGVRFVLIPWRRKRLRGSGRTGTCPNDRRPTSRGTHAAPCSGTHDRPRAPRPSAQCGAVRHIAAWRNRHAGRWKLVKANGGELFRHAPCGAGLAFGGGAVPLAPSVATVGRMEAPARKLEPSHGRNEQSARWEGRGWAVFKQGQGRYERLRARCHHSVLRQPVGQRAGAMLAPEAGHGPRLHFPSPLADTLSLTSSGTATRLQRCTRTDRKQSSPPKLDGNLDPTLVSLCPNHTPGKLPQCRSPLPLHPALLRLVHSRRHSHALVLAEATMLPKAIVVTGFAALARAQNGFDLITPLIGTVNGGNVFAGASLPYGMAKAVADVSGANTAGWAYDFSNVTGFSAQHDSGTGGNPSQGQFPLSIQPYCPDDVLEKCQFGSKFERAVNYRAGTPHASPGYFTLGIKDGIDVEATVTEHTAIWNFNFTPNATHGHKVSPLMLLDLTDIQDSRQNASVSVDPHSGRITANGTFLPSFGVGSYMSYVCVDFKGAGIRDTGVWVNERAGTEPKELFVNRGYSLFYIQAGGFVRFQAPADNVLQARVGVSFLSTEQACSNAENEVSDWDFSRVRKDAEVSISTFFCPRNSEPVLEPRPLQ